MVDAFLMLKDSLFLSNNCSVYVQDLMQYVYAFKFAGNHKDSDFNSDNSSIKLICNEEFTRSDVLRLLNVNKDKKEIYVELVKGYQSKHTLPVLLFLSQTIGVDEEAKYEFSKVGSIDILLQTESLFMKSKFYGLAVLARSKYEVIRGHDLVSGASFEWVIEAVIPRV